MRRCAVQIAIGLLLFFSVGVLSISISYAYMIDDPVGIAWPTPGYDRIGAPAFEIFGMDIVTSDSNIILDLYTNYPKSGFPINGWNTQPADLGIDVNRDNTYSYGLAFTNHNGVAEGTLYKAAEWFTSNDHAPSRGYVYFRDKKVTIKSGTPISNNNPVNWLDNDSSNDADPSGDDPNVPDWRVNVALNNNDFSSEGYIGTYDFFYGGATCANDYIEGEITITPEPTSMILFGLGALGFGSVRRKKIKF